MLLSARFGSPGRVRFLLDVGRGGCFCIASATEGQVIGNRVSRLPARPTLYLNHASLVVPLTVLGEV